MTKILSMMWTVMIIITISDLIILIVLCVVFVIVNLLQDWHDNKMSKRNANRSKKS